MDWNINFPNLHIYLDHVGKSIEIFGIEIAFYGIVIAIGMAVAILLGTYEAKRTGQDVELYYDLAIWAIILGVLGARIYYVIFSWDYYKDDLLSILNFREGGLAIYGGVIVGGIVTLIFSLRKKMHLGLVVDTAAIGMVTGQMIGRWGNFFNREVFGGYTDNIFAMQLPLNAVRTSDVTAEMLANLKTIDGVMYIQVHPTFLYESLWNLALLILMLWIARHRVFKGQVFFTYMAGYGIGRFWIEGIRTDRLCIADTNIAVSQVLAAVCAVVSAVLMIYFIIRTKKREGAH